MSWSWVHTVYSIHRVQHLPKIVCLPFILMITSWPLNVASAAGMTPYTIDCHQTSSPCELRGKITLSQSHSCELTNWWIESQDPALRPLTTSKYSTKLAQSRPPNLLDRGLQVHISKFAWSRPTSVSPKWLDNGLQVHISKLAGSWPRSASTTSLDYGLRTHAILTSKCVSSNSLDHGLQVHTIVASRGIYKLAQSRSRSTSLSSLDHSLQVYLQIHSIPALKCISKLARSWPQSVSRSSLDCHFLAHLELLSSTACSHSPDGPCVEG